MKQVLTPRDLLIEYGFNINTQKYKRWLYRKGDPEGLPYIKLGGSVRYKRQQIEDYIQKSSRSILHNKQEG